MRRNSFKSLIKELDFYPKFREDNQKKTTFGGIVAIVSFFLILILFLIKFQILLSTPPTKKFFVNTNFIPRKSSNKLNESDLPKMNINFDISFFHLPCILMHIDILDYMKESTIILDSKIRMQRYDFRGDPIYENLYPKDETIELNSTYCGSCFSLKSGCCNSCHEIRHLFKSKSRILPAIASIDQCVAGYSMTRLFQMLNESCRIHGSITTKQHPGYILMEPGKIIKNSSIYNKLNISFNNLNLSHKINHFSFGSQIYDEQSALDNTIEIQEKQGKMKTFYFIKIVPIGMDGVSFTYSSSSFQSYRNENSKNPPSILLKYDISPISAIDVCNFTFYHFISQFIEIVGGIYAIAAFIDLFSAACLHLCHKDDDLLKLL